MTWEETIKYIRSQSSFEKLVHDAYLSDDLKGNVERYRKSQEFLAILDLIKEQAGSEKIRLLDIGAGNGIASISLALEGFDVEAVEPDLSDTVGCKAIEHLKESYNLNNINIHQAFGENLPFDDGEFDLVFVRQALHHADNLPGFMKDAARVLKPQGIFIAVREHVIYDDRDKSWFLEEHPLQQFYGGENAFLLKEYLAAFENVGLSMLKVFKHFDSVINYFPLTIEEYNDMPHQRMLDVENGLKRRLGALAKLKILRNVAHKVYNMKYGTVYDEKRIPGRMYSFIASKI